MTDIATSSGAAATSTLYSPGIVAPRPFSKIGISNVGLSWVESAARTSIYADPKALYYEIDINLCILMTDIHHVGDM